MHASSRKTRSNSPPPPPPPREIAFDQGGEGFHDGNGSSSYSASEQYHDEAHHLGKSDAYVARLAGKVQRQANELLDLQAEVEDQAEYAKLCEQFVVALDPSQPLPLSRNGLQEVQGRLEREKSQSGHVNKSSRHTLTTLTRQYDAACKKAHEMAERVVELERQLGEETRTRELVNKRVSALQGKLSDKESKLLQARRATPNVARLQENLNSVTERAEKLNTENCQMRKTLESEAKTNEEQRIYIEVLQAALKARAENLGLDPDQLVNSQQAKFSALAAEATISRLEEAKDKAAKETQALNDLLQLESARVKQLQDRLEWYEPSKEHKSPSEEGSKHDNQLLFNGQRQASPRSDALSIDMLKSQLARLRKENETLVDYVRETVEPLKSKNAELEACLNSTAKVLEETSLRQSTTQEETVLLKDKVEEFRLKLVEKDIELNSAFEARDAQVNEKSELKKEVIALEEKVETREQELTERENRMKELEAEVTAMLKQTSEARETRQVLEDTRNALRCERKEIVIVEEKRLQLEDEVRRLEGELATCNVKLERSETIAQDAERDTQGLRDRLRETKTKLEASMNEQRDISDDLERAKEELAPLRAFRQRVSQLEKAISDSSTDAEGSRLDGLELVDYVLHALSNIVDKPKEGGPKVDDPMAFNSLEVILPNLNSLLCSAKSQVARSLGKQKRLLEELDQAESRFDVEKRLLHDEIHSLRSKLDQYNQSGGSQRDSTELKELREDYAVLEAKYLALEQEADQKDYDRGKAVDTLGNEGQVALLQSDLDKATRLVRDHEHLTKQLEEQLLDVENQLSLVDDETEQVRQLCYQTLKSVSARYGSVNAAVNQYFIGRPFPLPSDTLYQSISTICELLPFVLEHDADHTSSTSNQKRLGAQRRGHARAGSMNTSLLRSQRILNETRSNLDGSAKPSSPRYDRGRKESRSRSRSSSRGRRHRVHAYSRRRAAEDADDEGEFRSKHGESVHVACLQGRSTIRAHSPARVRLYKDGSIQMSTFEKESSTNSGHETNDDDSSSLDAAIRRFDRVDRVRRHAGNRRPGTPLSRRFVQDFQSARDRLRRLNNSSNY